MTNFPDRPSDGSSDRPPGRSPDASPEREQMYLEIVRYLESKDIERAAQAIADFRLQEGMTQRCTIVQASLLELQGQLPQAATLLEDFCRKNLDSGVARTNLARLQWKQGNRVAALSTLRFGLLQSPNQERSLHLYAAFIEEDSGLSQAITSLKMLCSKPGAWMPAWVAAQLASQRGAADQVATLLLLGAQQAQETFPSNLQGFESLLQAVPVEQQRQTASLLRPYVRREAQVLIDALLAQSSVPVNPNAGSQITCVHGSTWRHWCNSPSPISLIFVPVILLQPENWGAQEMSGRLGRGFGLLLAEYLQAVYATATGVLLESSPQGIRVRRDRISGVELANLAKGTACQNLVASYLTFAQPQQFVLDAEIYSSSGQFLGIDSARGEHPSLCLEQLAAKLAQRCPAGTTASPSTDRPPVPRLDFQDALARETSASFLLCAEGKLQASAIHNPGLALDTLVEYAVTSQDAATLLTLWGGIEAAARADLPGGRAQQTVMRGIVEQNPWLSRWTSSH